MRRAPFVLLAALGLAIACAGAARAQTFVVVPTGPVQLPSYEEPNTPGSIRVPSPLSRAPARPAVLPYSELVELWRRAGSAYGVPWQVLGAINKIESNFGRNMGPSSAGALGWMQFIPSSWMRWGMDADGDGIADPWDPQDAVYSAARYLAAAGAHDDLERSIFAYNHADWYVEDVLELARLFGGDSTLASFGRIGPGVAFGLDDLEQRLSEARRAVGRAQRALPALEKRLEQLDWKVVALEEKAGDPDLSDKRFEELDGRIAALEAERESGYAKLERAREELADAIADLEALEAEAEATPAFGSAGAYGSPESLDGYVFPVGGGPKLVSVGHHHHDYPAADIAAPEGSPLYALAAGTVVEAYPRPEGRCGIGLKLRLDTGLTYVYCHLSYLEPSVTPGVALSAGAHVGLVGSTGNSTGPHLHLGLVPAVAYPQEEAWFESFAGRAFSWQDAPTPRRARPAGPVFRVIEAPAESSSVQVIGFTS
jgi:murein DD-endopeptidase MepM/ murein hydrolase activator NlpD